MRAFAKAFEKKKGQLTVAIAGNGLMLVIASSLMYFIETEAQPDVFGSIPEAMWWGIVTLTTVGYGAVRPVTPLGKLVGSVVAVLGIGLFALPASIMSSGFIEESSYEMQTCPDCGHEFDWQEDMNTSVGYDIGEWTRIDIASQTDYHNKNPSHDSDLNYQRHHGLHGEITEKKAASGSDTIQYTVHIPELGEEITTSEKNLRTPYHGRRHFD